MTASTHNSLKSLSGNSPGIELATRHCYILEDPPNDNKELAGSDRYINSCGAYILIELFNISDIC